jgi:hypothetical protein
LLLEQAGKADISAVAWAATEKFQDNIIQISRTLQTCHNLSLGDKVAVRKGPSLNDLQRVSIIQANGSDPIPEGERSHWEWYLEHALGQ